MKAIIIARVSTEEQREAGNSLPLLCASSDKQLACYVEQAGKYTRLERYYRSN